MTDGIKAPQLVKKEMLCERLGISERTLENMVKEDAFPQPVRIGRYVYWSEVAVRNWRERLFSAQEAWGPSRRQ